ncbi:MAG: hypothetical protein KDK07_14915 [Bauldia sp.]|nr:hypothetical protein [Bauldia sp.]
MEGFRGFIIRTAEMFVLILVVVAALGGAMSGWGSGAMSGGALGGILGLVIGGAIGFVFGCVGAAYFFLFLEIAQNTRAMRRYYEQPPQ